MCAPPERRLRDFDWGVMDNRRATIRGVLMDVKSNSLPGYASAKTATADGDFLAHLPGESAFLKEKVDAELLVSGIAMSVFNVRGEFIGVQMDVVRPDDFRSGPATRLRPLVSRASSLASGCLTRRRCARLDPARFPIRSVSTSETSLSTR